MKELIFPIIQIALSFSAGVVYASQAQWKRAIYMALGAAITAVVVFMKD